MSAGDYRELLDRAASLWGIDAEFWDIWGHKHITSDDTKRAILKGCGVPADDAGQVRRALEARAWNEWSRLLAPTQVASENQQPVEIAINVPAGSENGGARVEVLLETGRALSADIDLARLPAVDAALFEGRQFVRKMLALPAPLPLGYHEVTAHAGGQSAVMRLIVTPDRAWRHPALEDGRAAGVAFALYGLRSRRNWGCGDFTDLRAITDWVADELGASFIALNPLHAIHNRRPFNTSPYLPNSIFYQNFIYLDVEAVEDFNRSRRAQRCWHSEAVQRELEALRDSEFVEYERVAALKLRFLKLAFLEFLREYRHGTSRARAFRTFIEREGDLLDRFATYCALDEYLHRRDPETWVWTQWPKPYQDPESPAVAAFHKKHWRAVLFWKYVQWQIDLQLAAAQAYTRRRGLPIGLYHDLALATDRFGSDLWAHRPFYVSGARVGAPPDDFSPQGQDWAFPPPDSGRHYETGYRLFADSIAKNCRHGGALRIDHVMRFFRLYWIPDGADAAHGAYVRDRYEDLVRILALESVRNKVVVVGEDLGTVEPFVRETLARFGILSYRLFYFEKNSRGAFKTYDQYPVDAVVSSTTHDLPTLAGFWTGEDIEARRRAGTFGGDEAYRRSLRDRAAEKQKMLDLLHQLKLLPEWFPHSAVHVPELTGELHNAVIGFLALTPSRLMIVNQEDLTKEVAQQNLPATTWQYPNWSRKMRYTVEQLSRDRAARDFTAMFRNWLVRTGRILHGVGAGAG